MAEEITEEVEPTEVEETEVEAEVTPEETEEQVEEEEDKIPVRSTASYIIQRKDEKIKKLQSQLEELEAQEDPSETPSEIEERLARIEELTLGQVDDKDLTALYEKEPNARKYADKIKAYMEHDSYREVSPEVIYHHLSYQDTQKDSKREAADLEAEQSKGVGSSVRNNRSKSEVTAEDIKAMSMDEFAKYEENLQRQARS